VEVVPHDLCTRRSAERFAVNERLDPRSVTSVPLQLRRKLGVKMGTIVSPRWKLFAITLPRAA